MPLAFTQEDFLVYVKVEAEAVPEISQRYSIAAVPTCILLQVLLTFSLEILKSLSPSLILNCRNFH